MPQYPPSARTAVQGDVFSVDRAFALLAQVENTLFIVRQELHRVRPELAREALRLVRVVESLERDVKGELWKMTVAVVEDES